MSEPSNDPVETQLSAEFDSTPLRNMAIEAHEVYLELAAVGFPEHLLAKIIAQIISDAVLGGGMIGFSVSLVDGDDEDDDDMDEEDDIDGQYN